MNQLNVLLPTAGRAVVRQGRVESKLSGNNRRKALLALYQSRGESGRETNLRKPNKRNLTNIEIREQPFQYMATC